MKVLSLFDGISCGRQALHNLGINVSSYRASEICKDAIKVSKHNWPDIQHIGDVTKISNESNVDLLIGGSPCQGFSFAGKQLNFKDPRSELFFEYVRVKNLTYPKWFLLENVVMAKSHQDIISNLLGVDPIKINSRYFSAQNRDRLYWTNLPQIKPYIDCAPSLSDVIGRKVTGCAKRARYIEGGRTEQRVELRKDDKSNCITTVAKNCMLFENGSAIYPTQRELESLQTLPQGYTKAVSYSKAVKLLGNAWTCKVIEHILSPIA